MKRPPRLAAILVLGLGACRPQTDLAEQADARAGVAPADSVVADAGSAADPCEAAPFQDDGITVSAVDLFSPGKIVESTLSTGLGLPREKIGFENAREPYFFPIDTATVLPHVRHLQTRALDIPAWALAAVSDVRGYAVNRCAQTRGLALSRVLSELDARNNMSARKTGLHRQQPRDLDSELDPQEPLLAAFRAVYSIRTPWPRRPASAPFAEHEKRVQVLADLLDTPTQRALARLVLGMARAEQWRLAAFKRWYPNGVDYTDLASVFTSRNTSIERARTFDYNGLARAGMTLSQAAGQLAAFLAVHPLPDTLNFRLSTPLGDVVLNGLQASDTYRLSAPALVVDQHGSDTYNGVIAGPALESIPLSVLIDVEGDDRYVSSDTDATQGAGVLSFGFLFDLAGNDEYSARDVAQGAGVFGIGALWDGGGSDRYKARYFAQGAGQFGIGVNVDLAGDDDYRVVSFGQGYGFVRSAGLLLDVSGNDRYDADDVNIVNPSVQTAQHNVSMAQGTGFGMRGNDYPDSMGGGVGILADLAGNDRYSCGLFCQGSGYWFGHGILYDRGGDDAYKSVWYVQGAAAHFAIGTFIDEAGNDVHEATHNMSQGAGHDGSIGILLEGGGDDSYTVTNLSLGGANDIGIGLFVDAAGADVYGASGVLGTSYGQTSSTDFSGFPPRVGMLSLGLFLELAGVDAYKTAPPEARNGGSWKRTSGGWAPTEHRGSGRDLE